MHSTPSRGRMRRLHTRLAATAVATMSATLLAACGGGDDGKIVLNVYLSPEPSGAWQKAVDDCEAAADGRYEVKMNVLPAAADGQRQQMVRRLAADDDQIDILGMDVTWVPEFAEAGWIREWTGQVRTEAEQDALDGPLETATWQDKLYAAPFNTNTQLLWYRSDLVSDPPRTWDEMIQMSEDLAAQNKPSYIEIQGAQYEGLTVWFNSLVASAGGSILNEDGTEVTLEENDAGRRALETMQKMGNSAGADPSLSTTMEDQARLAMEAGNAAFELNYPFVYPSWVANKPDMVDVLKWAPWPSLREGEPSHVTIGGINLAVSKFSKHPDEAFEATLCIRNQQHQLDAAQRGGLPPTMGSLYDRLDPKLYPFAEEIREAVDTGSVRPKTPAYQSVSIAISHTLSPPSGVSPDSTLSTLDGQISDALESKGLIP